MPIGEQISVLPPWFFILVHLVAFGLAAYFAYRAFGINAQGLGWGFTLYAIAELVYMTYHLDWTVILFAHTIAEVLNLVAFILIFVAAVQRVVAPGRREAAA